LANFTSIYTIHTQKQYHYEKSYFTRDLPLNISVSKSRSGLQNHPGFYSDTQQPTNWLQKCEFVITKKCKILSVIQITAFCSTHDDYDSATFETPCSVASILDEFDKGRRIMVTSGTATQNMLMLVDMANNSELSSIRQTVTQIIHIIDDPLSSAKDLTNIIVTDPPLAAKLLRLANSAFYGYPKTISGIHEAIVCIGFDAVKELALNQKVCELFAQEDEGFGYSRFALWKHSVAVAICSKLIYQRQFGVHSDAAYAAGLLHDLGIIVIDQFLQFDFLIILRDAVEENNNLQNVEEAVLQFTHADIGRALAESWKFPDELSIAIGNHHQPLDVEKRYAKVATTLFVADYLIQGLHVGFSDSPHRNRIMFRQCMKRLRLKEDILKIILKDVSRELTKMEDMGWYRGAVEERQSAPRVW
jgi:putative nucleotidyltransferase with HDIG domain